MEDAGFGFRHPTSPHYRTFAFGNVTWHFPIFVLVVFLVWKLFRAQDIARKCLNVFLPLILLFDISLSFPVQTIIKRGILEPSAMVVAAGGHIGDIKPLADGVFWLWLVFAVFCCGMRIVPLFLANCRATKLWCSTPVVSRLGFRSRWWIHLLMIYLAVVAFEFIALAFVNPSPQRNDSFSTTPDRSTHASPKPKGEPTASGQARTSYSSTPVISRNPSQPRNSDNRIREPDWKNLKLGRGYDELVLDRKELLDDIKRQVRYIHQHGESVGGNVFGDDETIEKIMFTRSDDYSIEQINWFEELAEHVEAKYLDLKSRETFYKMTGSARRAARERETTEWFEAGKKASSNEVAFRLFYEAAALGNPEAQLKISIMFQDGSGIEKNDEQSIYWAEQAALAENVVAQGLLILKYLFGVGVAPDADKALEWAKREFENGGPVVQSLMSIVDASEPDNLDDLESKDPSTYKSVFYFYGCCYDAGIGIESSHEKAMHFYARAAKLGDLKSSFLVRLNDRFKQ